MPASQLLGTRLYRVERVCGVREAASGEIFLELPQNVVPHPVVGQNDGYAFFVVGSGGCRRAKFADAQTAQTR